jgi:N utilization substance protein B
VIDKIITSNLKGWTQDRLPKAVVAVLRVGIYEILFNDEIPDIAAIDEAMKISYKYCDDKDCDFINGMLHKIYENKEKKA